MISFISKSLIIILLLSNGLYAGSITLFSDNHNKTPSMPTDDTNDTRISQYHQDTNTSMLSKGFTGEKSMQVSIDKNGSKKRTGTLKLTKKIEQDGNVSYVPDNDNLRELFKHRGQKGSFNALMDNMKKNSNIANDLSTLDKDKLTKEYLYSQYPDSKEANQSKKADTLTEALLQTLITPKNIKCYVKRKLVPKFYCPIPGFENGALVGGSPEDDLEKSKKHCDSFCMTPVDENSCTSVNSGFNQETNFPGESLSFDLSESEQDTNKTLTASAISELEFQKLSYNISVQRVPDGPFSEISLEEIPLYYKVSVRYTAHQGDGNYIESITRHRQSIDSQEMSLSYFSFSNPKDIEIILYEPKLRQTGAFIGHSASDIIQSMTANTLKVTYTDDKYYFCGSQKVPNADECKGGTVYEVDPEDNPSFKICKKTGRMSGPEHKYGAFYTSNTCAQACRLKQECVQSFSHFSNLTGNAQYEIEIGCIDDPTNTKCVPSACEAYFRTHEMPQSERVYSQASTSKETVVAGVQVAGVSRPRVDITAELEAGASGSDTDYDDVFLDSMKDTAYTNMINKGTFNYSAVSVGKDSPFEHAAKIISGSTTAGSYYTSGKTDYELFWKLKPNSYDIKDGSDYYIYVVALVENAYVPISGAFLQEDNTVSYTDHKTFKDLTYLTKNPDGSFSPYRIEQYKYVYFDVENSAGKTGWQTNTQHRRDDFVSYDAPTDKMLVTSSTTPAIHFTRQKFDGLRNYEEFQLAFDPYSLFEKTPGISIQTQEISNPSSLPIKVYNPSKLDAEKKATMTNYLFYGIYSKTPLNLQELHNLVDEKHLIYNSQKGNQNKFEIHGDGANSPKNVKMFIKGRPTSTTVTTELTPNIEEEGKDVILFMFLMEGNIQ